MINVRRFIRIRQFINFSFFRFVSTKRFHSPWYKVGIFSYSCLSSCSTGTLGLFVASFWGELQNFNTKNDIMPPITADKTYIQISWDTHIFSPSCIAVCTATVTIHLIRAIYLEYLDWLILTWLVSGQKMEVQTPLLSDRILMTLLDTRYLFEVSWLADSNLTI